MSKSSIRGQNGNGEVRHQVRAQKGASAGLKSSLEKEAEDGSERPGECLKKDPSTAAGEQN